MVEWGKQNSFSLFCVCSSFVSLIYGLFAVIHYRQSRSALKQLMLDEDFARPHFVVVKSIYFVDDRSFTNSVIHRKNQLLSCISLIIDVNRTQIEIDLCFITDDGIRFSFVEYSGTKTHREIAESVEKSLKNNWFATAVQNAWKLETLPAISSWDEISMFTHLELYSTEEFSMQIEEPSQIQRNRFDCLCRCSVCQQGYCYDNCPCFS